MIEGVAVKFKCGADIRLPRPNRHSDCFKQAQKLGITAEGCMGDNQGFYDHDGRYLNRKQAMSHVRRCGQKLLIDTQMGHENRSQYLFSEDVW